MVTVLGPVVGYVLDHIGKRAKVLVLSCGIILLAYILILALPDNGSCYTALPTSILIGFYATIFTVALFPSIPLVCEMKVIGTAFGILDCFQ